MARPRQEPGYDYYTQPYNPKWEPLPDRIWAEQFVDEDGNEEYEAFRVEFRKRYKFLTHNHGDTYLPQTVSYYLRHDAMGSRRDIDEELAAIPLSEEEVVEREAARKSEVRELRRAALKSRGLAVPGEVPKTRAKLVAQESASLME